MSDVTFFRGENPLKADKLNQAFSERVYRGGDTMTGMLTLWRDPVGQFDAATKQYVDATYIYSLNAFYLKLQGGTMQGPILLHGAPTAPLMAATRQYVDDKAASIGAGIYLPLTGGTLTGGLFLAADPTGPLQAATKQYVDSRATAASTLPLMNGTAAIGSLLTYARADHVHATDTSRYAASNPAGYVTAAQAAAAYVLPTASTTTLGGVKVDGTSVTISGGVISASAGAGLYLPLSGGTLTGALNVANNVQITATNFPQLILTDTDAPVDQKKVSMYVDGTGGVVMQHTNDASNVGSPFLSTIRSGVTSSVLNLASTTINLNGAVFTSAGLSAGTVFQANGGRIISYSGNNPSFCAFNSAGYAAGMWCQSDGALVFGWMNGDGAVNSTRMYLERTNSSLIIDGSTYVNGRLRGTNGIMNVNGLFAVADNEAYYLARNATNGTWAFVENNQWNWQVMVNGDTSTRSISYAQHHFAFGNVVAGNDWSFYFGLGGSGKVFNFAANWYWDWNPTNGSLHWYNRDRGAQWIMRYDGLCYNAALNVGGIGAYVDYSDERGKTDIQPATAGLNEVLRLDPIRFRRIRILPTGTEIDKHEDVGFSAQAVRSVLPEAVSVFGVELPDGTGGLDSDDPTLGLATTPIVAALVNAVKELHAEVQALKGAQRVSH